MVAEEAKHIFISSTASAYVATVAVVVVVVVVGTAVQGNLS